MACAKKCDRYTVLNNTAGLLGLEITGIRDKKTKKEWKRGG